MRLIFVGPPGAGKGTQATKLAERFGIAHVSTGDLFRAAVREGTPLGKKADGYMKAGQLVPDDVTIAMLLERIAKPDAARAGFLLDGFPRTIGQAEALDHALAAAGSGIDAVVVLEVPDARIVERIVGRRSDPVTGRIYHLRYDPPPSDVASRVVQRGDDTEEACRTRLAAYHAQTAPLVPYYEKQGLVRKVDGVGDQATVFGRIEAALAAS
jgi:adenylate kinase